MSEARTTVEKEVERRAFHAAAELVRQRAIRRFKDTPEITNERRRQLRAALDEWPGEVTA